MLEYEMYKRLFVNSKLLYRIHIHSTANVISFELKRDINVESVKIFDNNGKLMDSVALTKQWQKFTYWPMEQVRILYNGHAGDGTVFFREASHFEIELTRRWNEWSCGSPNENKRCEQVRSGDFNWDGESYLVSLKKVLQLF